MKTRSLLTLALLTTTSLLAADLNPKDEVTNASRKLGEEASYSWRTTIVVPDDAPFKPGPTDGKTEKGGFTWFSMSMMDNKMEALVMGSKGAVKQDGNWKALEEFDKEEGFGRMPAIIARNVKTPAKEAADLVAAAKELKKEGDVISGDFTEAGAKKLQRFGPSENEGPTVTEASGSVKFWVKDGMLTKYEFKLKGKINFNGNEFPNERTTTVEIKEVGKTKLEVPEEVRNKTSG